MEERKFDLAQQQFFRTRISILETESGSLGTDDLDEDNDCDPKAVPEKWRSNKNTSYQTGLGIQGPSVKNVTRFTRGSRNVTT